MVVFDCILLTIPNILLDIFLFDAGDINPKRK